MGIFKIEAENSPYLKLAKSLEVEQAVLVILLTVPCLDHRIRPPQVEDGLP
jgi:hypothetical protein